MLASLVIAQAGCWGSGGSEPEPEPEAKELKASKDPLSTEVPETELVMLSKKLYQVGMYTVARDSLASLKDRYPLGAYANFAELKHADSFFFNREYNEAAKAYENIIKNYPGSPDLPYVKLQAARSHIASARDAGRDRQPWERGLTIYDELVSEYSGSAYADTARAERAHVVRELTAYDREIIEFYRREGNQAAVDAREKRFNERWGSRLDDSGVATTGSAAGDTQKPLKSLGIAVALETAVSPPTPPTSGEPAAEPPTDQPATSPLLEGRIAIQSVQCRNEAVPFAVIELTRLPDSVSESAEPLALAPVEGRVVLEGLGLTARQESWSCFGVDDLKLAPDGSLAIQTEQGLILSALNGPPRLLISAGK